MASIQEVRAAIGRGDNETARRLLRQLVKEDESAEAWYLVAQVSTSDENKIKALQKALLIDPNHPRAKNLLRKLGGQELDPLRGIRETAAELRSGVVRREATVEAGARRVPRGVFYLLLGIAILLPLLVVLLTIVSNALPPLPDELPTETPGAVVLAPDPKTFITWRPQDLAAQFSASFPPTSVSVKEVSDQASQQTPVKGRVYLNVTNPDGSQVEVRLLFYNSLEDMMTDQARLTPRNWHFAVNNQNAALIYRDDLNLDTLRQLVDVLDAASSPAQVQANVASATAAAESAAQAATAAAMDANNAATAQALIDADATNIALTPTAES